MKQTVDPQDYRDAMARYAGHVQIVTAARDGEKRGVTVTAACSVSDNPGTVLVCLAEANPLNRLFIDAGAFALNTLSARHQPLADIFSGLVKLPPEERFRRGEWDMMVTGAPALVGAAAVYDCTLLEAKTIATHTVLFGRVAGLRLGEPEPALIYKDRGYHQL